MSRRGNSIAWVCAALSLVALACNLTGAAATSTLPAALPSMAPPPPTVPVRSPTEAPTTAPTERPTEPVPSSTASVPVAEIDALLRTCPNDAELGRIQADFEIVFDSRARLPEYSCTPARIVAGEGNPRLAVFQALRAIEALQFEAPLPWTGLSLYDWLGEAIDGLVLTTTDISYCCDAANRIVLKAGLLSQPQYAVWYDPSAGIGLMNLVGLIVHEARHSEIGGHTCGNDDQTLNELGAWGVQYWMFTWMSDHAHAGLLTEQETSAAHEAAQSALERICNP